MTIGAFAVVAVVAGQGDDEHSLADYRGLARRQPLLAGLFTLFLLAQAGRAAHRWLRREALGVQRGGRRSASTRSR